MAKALYPNKKKICDRFGIKVDLSRGWCRKASSVAYNLLSYPRYLEFMKEVGWSTLIRLRSN